MTYKIRITTISLAIFISLSFAANASDVTIPHDFTDGSPAKADEVNANFDAVKQAVDDNHDKIKCATCGEDNVLTVPSIKYTEPKEGSITYSAMGFTPSKAELRQGTLYYQYFLVPVYEKNASDGALYLTEDHPAEEAFFYQNVTLPSGVEMTALIVHMSGNAKNIEVSLQKRLRNGSTEPLVEVTHENGNVYTVPFDPELIKRWDQLAGNEQPTTYYIEVKLISKNARFYSATILYRYLEP